MSLFTQLPYALTLLIVLAIWATPDVLDSIHKPVSYTHLSQQQETRIDCRHHCFACGILPKLKELRRETPPEAWACPPVTSVAERRGKRGIELPVVG